MGEAQDRLAVKLAAAQDDEMLALSLLRRKKDDRAGRQVATPEGAKKYGKPIGADLGGGGGKKGGFIDRLRERGREALEEAEFQREHDGGPALFFETGMRHAGYSKKEWEAKHGEWHKEDSDRGLKPGDIGSVAHKQKSRSEWASKLKEQGKEIPSTDRSPSDLDDDELRAVVKDLEAGVYGQTDEERDYYWKLVEEQNKRYKARSAKAS